MTVRELKNLLSDFDDNMEVYLQDLEDDTESGTKVIGNVMQEELVNLHDEDEEIDAVVITF